MRKIRKRRLEGPYQLDDVDFRLGLVGGIITHRSINWSIA